MFSSFIRFSSFIPILLVLSFATPATAQRVRTLEKIINTPLASTAKQQCRAVGGNLLLTVQLSFHHCYHDAKIATVAAKHK